VELWSRRIGLLAVIGFALFAVPHGINAQGSQPLRRIAFLSGDDTCSANRGFSG
jgi:hypothetical protein